MRRHDKQEKRCFPYEEQNTFQSSLYEWKTMRDWQVTKDILISLHHRQNTKLPSWRCCSWKYRENRFNVLFMCGGGVCVLYDGACQLRSSYCSPIACVHKCVPKHTKGSITLGVVLSSDLSGRTLTGRMLYDMEGMIMLFGYITHSTTI